MADRPWLLELFDGGETPGQQEASPEEATAADTVPVPKEFFAQEAAAADALELDTHELNATTVALSPMGPSTSDELTVLPRWGDQEGSPRSEDATAAIPTDLQLKPSLTKELPELQVPHEIDQLLGSELHGHVLERYLGSGSHAHVFEARHRFLNKTRAAKVMRRDFASTEQSRVRMAREAELLSQLRHPNVVSVDDYGYTQSGLPFIFMELLEGLTLDAWVDKHQPDQVELARILQSVAMGLAEAHRLGIVHRDLKPSNIMVQDKADPWVKILDFGLAREALGELTSITRADQILGTPHYMAPEQVSASHTVGPAADVYALGAVCYRLLRGQAPFTGSFEAIMRGHLESPVTPLPPSSLASLTHRMLQKDPTLRPDTAQVVKELGLVTERAGEETPRDTELGLKSPLPALQNSPAVETNLPPNQSSGRPNSAMRTLVVLGGLLLAIAISISALVFVLQG